MPTIQQLKEQAQHMKETLQEQAPNQRQLIGAVTIVTVIVLLTTIGGLVTGGLAIGAAVLTPVFIFFSPVLVPLGTVFFVGVAGLLSAAGVTLVGVSTLRWLYHYFMGYHPVGSDKVDAAKNRIVDTASHLKERASDYVHDAQENFEHVKDQTLATATYLKRANQIGRRYSETENATVQRYIVRVLRVEKLKYR
ncbi:hypothetical protein R1sor_010308 [Riccia sorocarpa]|uniref:Oleosin n=1 Tax=Riccia sorocarpa TaxID=122646 RepID=A0ABD3I0D4_9MARC